MATTFFEHLKALYSKANLEYNPQEFNPWQMLMWISHDKDNFVYVERVAKYLFVINPKYIWKYLRYKLPVNRNKFLKYVKKDKLEEDDAIQELCNQYGISKFEAKQCLE